uniref:Uncharacterized protein n=1 Tax=Triticum urartu TaxID=4572 RepID=A0A8R7Q742_TRIUA
MISVASMAARCCLFIMAMATAPSPGTIRPPSPAPGAAEEEAGGW